MVTRGRLVGTTAPWALMVGFVALTGACGEVSIGSDGSLASGVGGGHQGSGGGSEGEQNGVSWQTSTVSLTADDFLIVADGKRFTAQGVIVGVDGDPSPTDRSLTLTWEEHGVEMRLNMYFEADSQHWWVNEIRTYNGQASGGEDWLYYEGTFFESPIGGTYRGDVDLTNMGSDPYRGELHIHGMKLSTTMVDP